MKSVLFTASTFSHIWNFHRPYLRSFHNLGWQVHVACGGQVHPLREADRVIALPFEKSMTSMQNFKAQRQLRHLMEKNHYTLVCTHTSLAAFFTRRAAAGVSPRPPLVNVAHGYLFDDQTPCLKRSLLLMAEKLTAPQTDLLLTMNQWDYALAQKHHLAQRIENIPGMGVDFTRFAPIDADERAEIRQELSLAPEDFALIYAAEFSARKNQAMLLRSLIWLPPQVKLVLAGEGALLEACRTQAQEAGVAPRVRFLGHRSDMPRLLRGCDAAVASSRSEGLPFHIMEAMYAGLPVVASAVKGHTDLIEDKITGLLYPFDDAKAFVQAVLRLTDQPFFAAALGEKAHDAAFYYGLEPVLPQVLERYLSLV